MANIEWLGHASFRITGEGKTIYIDPWKLKESAPAPADLILLSHSHYDHLSPDDINKISHPGTQIIGSADCAPQLKRHPFRAVSPDETIHFGTIVIRTTRAYNPHKEFHPRENNWMGFILAIEGEVIYYAGDTDVIPEMSSLGKIDVALLPIGGTYTMTADEAAEAVRIIKPAHAIPYHWGDFIGTEADAKRFKMLCTSPVEVRKAA